MKKILYIITVAAIVAVSCTKPSAVENYSVLKKTSYSSLTPELQVAFTEELISKLKADTDLKSANAAMYGTTLILATREVKTKGERLGTPPKGFKEKVAYLKAKGIKEPEKYLQLQFASMLYWRKIAMKYPELSNLDPKTRARVLTAASGRSPYAFRKQLRAIAQKRADERKNPER